MDNKPEYGDELFIYAMVLLEEAEEKKRMQDVEKNACTEVVNNNESSQEGFYE